MRHFQESCTYAHADHSHLGAYKTGNAILPLARVVHTLPTSLQSLILALRILRADKKERQP